MGDMFHDASTSETVIFAAALKDRVQLTGEIMSKRVWRVRIPGVLASVHKCSYPFVKGALRQADAETLAVLTV